MRLLTAATLITPDPDATARLYQTWLDYQPIEAGVISSGLAASWGTPAMEGRRYTVLIPESRKPVYLRFVQGNAPTDYQPLRSFGWGAIELCVQNVLAVNDRMKHSPFKIIGPPKALDGSPAIWPMQVQGPDGEIIFLTEIRDDEPTARLPRANTLVDCLFIAVLACADMVATRKWFETELGFSGGPDFTLAYTMLSRAFDQTLTTKHKIAVLGQNNDAFLQLDQYPEGAVSRTVLAGELPPGIAMVSFVTLSGAAILPAGFENHPGIIYRNAPSRVVRTPEGSLIELIMPAG